MTEKVMNWSVDSKAFMDLWGGRHIFATFPETGNRNIVHHYHGKFDELEGMLRKANGDRGIFWTVNELNRELDPGRHRTKRMFIRARALFMDDDVKRENGDFRGDWPLDPSIIVETSEGKFHYYWIISDSGYEDGGPGNWIDGSEWQAVMDGIIAQYGGDKNARDLSRVLRLPGFRHLKNMKEGCGWVSRYMIRNDGYKWSELLAVFPRMEHDISKPKVIVSGKVGGSFNGVESKSNDLAIREIERGENYHENLISLSWQMKKDGVPDKFIVMSLQGMMERVKMEDRDDRWASRYDDIERIVAGAEGKSNEIESGEIGRILVDLEDLNEKLDKEMKERDDLNSLGKGDRADIPWPPGMLGGLAMNAYDMQRFQYKDMAVISAVGLVAGICGRKFNVSGMGLNVYLTLIMRTGMGKDQIDEFCNKCISEISIYDEVCDSFIGPSRFTGPPSIRRALSAARSRLCILTEGGLLAKGKAGDNLGIQRTLLSLYTRSGSSRFMAEESYSKEEDSLAKLRAPSLTLITEATPGTMLSAFKENESLERGELARQSLYRISDQKPSMNRGLQRKVDDDQLLRLSELAKTCKRVQNIEDPNAWNMEYSADIQRDIWDHSDSMVQMENKLYGTDDIASIMATRAHVKALKFAAIATVYNHRSNLTISAEEWAWGKAMVEYEMRKLSHFFSGSQFGEPIADCTRNVVAPRIVKMLNRGYKTKFIDPGPTLAKAGKFTMSNLQQACRRSKELQEIGDNAQNRSNPRSGLAKVVDFMISNGYLIKTNNGRYLQVTESFIAIFEK